MGRCPASLVTVLLLVMSGCAWEARRDYNRADHFRRAGDLAQALALAERGFASRRGDPQSVWHWQFRLLNAEILLSQRKMESALALLDGEPPSTISSRARIEARLLADRGYASVLSQKYDQGRQLLDRAYQVAAQAGAADLLSMILITRSLLHSVNGEMPAAEADARSAELYAARAPDRFLQATAGVSMGFLLLRQFRYDESIRWLERALQISRGEGYQGVSGFSITNLGWCYYRLGDFDKAERYMSEAEALMASSGRWMEQQTALGNLGSVHYSRQDYAGAVSYFRRALDIAGSNGFANQQALWLTNLAATYAEMGDLANAESCDRRALDLQARLHDPVVGVLPTLTAARIARQRRDFEQSRETYQEVLATLPGDPDMQWETHAGLAELYRSTGDTARAQAEFVQAIAILDDSWSRLVNNSSKLTFPTRVAHLSRDYVEFLMAQNRPRQALDFAESRRARLLSEKLGAPAAGSSFEAEAAASGRVLLSYWVAPERSYLWVTAPGAFRTFTLPPEPAIRQLVDRYSKAILDGRDAADAGRDLYDMLVAPARALLPPGARVVIVPDGPLHGLNFETLVEPSGAYWIEDATVEVAPSLRMLRAAAPPAAAAQSILLIGDPVQTDPSLAELPFAGKEISAIAGLYRDALVKTRGEARPEAYRAAGPSRFSAIHFAAHAVPNRDSPLDSAVVLSRGPDSSKLYAREVEEIPLTADMVTISACQSAGSRTYPGEGLVGFAWAFLSAGAHHVIASLWDVNDRSTAAFMQALYTGVQKGAEPTDALRAAKLSFVHAHDVRRKPYYWAPFQIYVR